MRIIAISLVVTNLMLPIISVYADYFMEPLGEAYGIQSGDVYMIKNVASGKYLTLPGYFDVKNAGSNGVVKKMGVG